MSDETAAPESTPAPRPAAAPGTADLLAPGGGPGTSAGATAAVSSDMLENTLAGGPGIHSRSTPCRRPRHRRPPGAGGRAGDVRSEEHTSELHSHSFISYAVFCLK